MGFYIRKAISVGPFRFNLSKSGIGVSAGVRGFRVGTSPNSNYVHMGRGGLYYKQTLPLSESNNHEMTPNQSGLNEEYEELEHAPLREIESGDITKMVDSSSAQLVSEINEKRKKIQIWPFVGGFGLLVTLLTLKKLESTTPAIILAIFTIVFTYFASIKDSLRKTTVVFYELEPEIESLFQKLHDTFDKLKSSSKKWHIEAESGVKDIKRNAGATSIIKRTDISIEKRNPPYVKTNIAIPSIPVGNQTLYFFPDKVLVFESNRVGAVSYPNLHIRVETTRFIEEESVPKDAKVVDRTWKYVNKSGGPDRRFKDNKELPIALYEDIHFTSNTGLNERVEVSKVGFGDGFAKAINDLSKSI